MNRHQAYPNLSGLLTRRPHALANITGSDRYPNIRGQVRFYQTVYGTVVAAELMGLPAVSNPCAAPIYAFHIHEGNSCTGNINDPFADAESHYNPDLCPHPYHAGDLPPLFNADGYAFSPVSPTAFRWTRSWAEPSSFTRDLTISRLSLRGTRGRKWLVGRSEDDRERADTIVSPKNTV